MSPKLRGCRWPLAVLFLGALGLAASWSAAFAQEGLVLPPLTAKVAVSTMSREAAVRWALENHPELATMRQQRGIAAAGVVIARTYPFNPVLESRIEGAWGPESAGITNSVLNEHKVLLELELRGQGNFRRQAACAALTRTEWEIAYQEVQVATRVLKSFESVLYRLEKLRLNDERIRLNERAAIQIRKLREQAKLSPADLILIQTEIDDAKAQGGAAELALVTADHELRRALGTVQEVPEPAGSLQGPMPLADPNMLVAAALEHRPDLRARQAAVAEADARFRLENSNRYGNPTLGPSYGLDTSQVSSVGITLLVPLPILNTRRGDIQQRQAEYSKAVLEHRQVGVQVQQEVLAALARMQRAQAWVERYEKEVLPNLRKSLEAVEKLFTQDVPGVDVLRVLEIRRNVLKGRDAYLDSLWERAQAQADLVGAVGDLSLVVGPAAMPCLPPPR